VAIVRIEGVGFELDDAREFAARARRQTTGPRSHRMTAWITLAAQIDQRVEDCGVDLLPLTDNEKQAAIAVLDEWRPSRDAPAAVAELRRRLTHG
jgi:hypothetical protein